MSSVLNKKVAIPEQGDINVDLSGAWPIEFDGQFELSGVIERDGSCEVVADDVVPDFYSVYAHMREGGVECLADFPDRAGAERFLAYAQSRFDIRDNLDSDTRRVAPRS